MGFLCGAFLCPFWIKLSTFWVNLTISSEIWERSADGFHGFEGFDGGKAAALHAVKYSLTGSKTGPC